MNCKPLDLATVVGISGPRFRHMNGLFVTVIERAPVARFFKLPNGDASSGGERCWIVRFAALVAMPLGDGGCKQTRYACCPDEYLRPFRDPGDDAQDETLGWLPVPSVEVTAC